MYASVQPPPTTTTKTAAKTDDYIKLAQSNFKCNIRRKCTNFALIYIYHYLSLSTKSYTMIVGLQQ